MNRCTRTLLTLATVVVASLSLSHADARADEARRQQLALEVMELTGASAVGAQVAQGLLAQLKPVFPTAPESLWIELAGAFSSEEIVRLSVPIYVKHFDEKELEALVQFYRSDLGQKVIRKMPLVMQESMAIGNTYGQRKAQEIVDTLRAAGHEPQGQ